MAHYRSSLCLLTCIACLGAAFSPSADGRQQIVNASYRVVSEEIAQANSPPDDRQDSNPPKPSPAPNKNKSLPPKTQKSNSKIPKPISQIIVILSQQRGLLMLGFAAVVVTAAAVFIMLKLVGSDDSNHRKRIGPRGSRHNPRNPAFSNPEVETNLPETRQQRLASGAAKPLPPLPYPVNSSKGYNPDGNDRPLPFILERGAEESEDAGVEGDRINSDIGTEEKHSNGNGDSALNIPETANRASELANRKKNISLPEKEPKPKLDVIEKLIEDLQHLNPAQRRKAIWELGQQGDSRAVEPLLDLLANSDSKQYSLILASVSEIGIRTLKPMNNAWSISLQNENPEVRKNTIRDLTRIYELVNQISHLLHRATDDPDTEVQETARWAINQLNRIRPRSGRDD
ncbi:HEAT repeat domain-containing protein [Microcoleus sp. bin38.metabat.b11b12b14.051]|uniref:HEAT repeat domain-containing protein n=1 Tax=Microcoleus sp. bin38.metabat.b11b12b14.051 TaxID=2742709 RepID=UPI0025D7CD62|nr:HEAT repeat domain-containing protein [Microcoleus sp. bin38.metabat.b11b12b14.051]